MNASERAEFVILVECEVVAWTADQLCRKGALLEHDLAWRGISDAASNEADRLWDDRFMCGVGTPADYMKLADLYDQTASASAARIASLQEHMELARRTARALRDAARAQGAQSSMAETETG